MRLRRYRVSFQNKDIRAKDFWTLRGAKAFYRDFRSHANLYKWRDGAWQWMCGARDLLRDYAA